jgi:hypothetical protein
VGLVVGLVVMVGAQMASAQPGPGPGAPPPPPPGAPASPYYAPPPPGPGYGPQPPVYAPAPERQGFLIGFGIGGGEIAATDCDGCESLGGFAFDFQVGGFISPRMAIMYDAFGVLRSENNLVWINGVNTAAIQYWVTPQLWLKGGLGFSQVRVDDGFGNSDAEYGFGGQLGVGFEVISSARFALDLSAKVSHGTFKDGGQTVGLSNAAVLVGFHWY